MFLICVDTVRVYDYLTKTALCMSRFNAPGSAMLWAPKIVSMLLRTDISLTHTQGWSQLKSLPLSGPQTGCHMVLLCIFCARH